MASKYKYRKSFTFQGKRYNVYGNSLEEVIAKKERKKIALEQEVIIAEHMTLSEWAEKCIDIYKKNLSYEGFKAYKSMVKRNILKHIGHMKLTDIRPIHLQEVLNLQEGMSRTQINYTYQQLSLLFFKAYVNRLTKTNLTETLEKPKAKPPKRRRALTIKERDAVINVAKTDRRYYLFLLMIFCGLRPSEAARVKKEDIINMQEQHLLQVKGTKTTSSVRLVPVPGELYDLIDCIASDEYIAVTKIGNPYLNKDKRDRLWKFFKRDVDIYMGAKLYRNAIIESTLADDFVMYNLRHEYCTDLARKGIDIRTAQKLMGHANISITANIYTNLTNDDILAAGKLLDAKNHTPNHTP